jgi:hypothetical protein
VGRPICGPDSGIHSATVTLLLLVFYVLYCGESGSWQWGQRGSSHYCRGLSSTSGWLRVPMLFTWTELFSRFLGCIGSHPDDPMANRE